jgi:pimeloyl-ACP methyl ester carboxylesterase
MKSILYQLFYSFYTYQRYSHLQKELQLQEKKINAGGLPFFYHERSSTHKPLVLLHGLLDASFGFRKMIPFLHKWKLIVPDLPGFGKNILPHLSVLWNLDIFARILYGVFQKLDLRDITLLGHSMGGLISQHICLIDQIQDQRIQRLILLSTGNQPNPRREKLRSLLFPKNRTEVMRLLHQLYHKNFPDPSGFIQDMLVSIWNSEEYQLLATNTIQRESEIFFGKKAGEIQVPVHLIVGEEDEITDLQSIQTLQSWIKGSTLDVLPEAKHAVHMEYPEQVANLINRYAGIEK